MEMIIRNSPKEFDAEDSYYDDDEDFPLRCWDCNINFTNKTFLYSHIYHHIKQPSVLLERVSLPPLKLTLKHSSSKGFEIIKSPHSSPLFGHEDTFKLDEKTSATATTDEEREDSTSGYNGSNIDSEFDQETMSSNHFDDDDIAHDPHREIVGEESAELSNEYPEGAEDIDNQNVDFNTDLEAENEEFRNQENDQVVSDEGPNDEENNGCDNNEVENITENESTEKSAQDNDKDPDNSETVSEKVSPLQEYPKIRIKTTGLLKESSVRITEITDEDNSDKEVALDSNTSTWTSAEDPLKISDTDNMVSLFNNNERAQDLGFCSTDSEFISLDRFEDARNSSQMQLYNHGSRSQDIDSLTGLPMQALAQQVSRLKPNSNSGMHQQNVLINIQQFPSMPPPPQPHYQPPMLYPHHSPHPNQYHYQYQPPPPNPYYSSAPPYPGQHMQPPPHPMTGPPSLQHPQSALGHHAAPSHITQQMSHSYNSQSTQDRSNYPGHMQMSNQQPYRPQMQQSPRNQVPGMANSAVGARMPSGMQTAQRSRPPNILRKQPNATGPRMGQPVRPNGVRLGNNAGQGCQQQQMQQKRPIDQKTGILDAKKRKFDILAPEKDDEDCQVICMQPKNTDGGLPQIENVQGGTPESSDNNIMNLPDSISLTVRNQPAKEAAPKKSDAKEVANILATRGITVTATPKPKEKPQQQAKTVSSSLNLNSAVSLIPSSTRQAPNKTNSNNGGSTENNLPTVDLTDDTAPVTPLRPSQPTVAQNKRPVQKTGLPFRCDLCNAQYPNSLGLMKHRQNFHKTNTGISDLGIPLINLKQPGIMQRLALLGISNYIPVPGQEGQSFALPIINARNANNMSAIGATQMLSLGQIRQIPHIPRANVANSAIRMPTNNMQKR